MRKAKAFLAVVLVLSGLAVVGCSKDKDVAAPPDKKLPQAPGNVNQPN